MTQPTLIIFGLAFIAWAIVSAIECYRHGWNENDDDTDDHDTELTEWPLTPL